ncbi:MAG: helix-turn-helix transcriptional regulator [Clostridia bacterium]|nr:helix-turn-helix transcriptional regulator [Clostridia bacterium]MBR2908607.1 helix-turn-helix transcriptional regulator [Clostridia bacterium]
MISGFQTKNFIFEYTESDIDNTVLWESHCHARYELIAVLEGDINVMLEGRDYRLTEGQTTVIPPLAYHTITSNKRGTYRRVTALFELSAIPEALHPRFLETGGSIAISSSEEARELKRICEKRDPSFYAPLAESLMIRLLYSNAEEREARTATETDAFLRKVILYIDEHLDEKISLDDLSRATSRSKSSFCHLFEAKMNISPKQYILRKKLALADKLIGEGTPPTVAAMQVGYENYSDFYRIYRRHFGISPTGRRTKV